MSCMSNFGLNYGLSESVELEQLQTHTWLGVPRWMLLDLCVVGRRCQVADNIYNTISCMYNFWNKSFSCKYCHHSISMVPTIIQLVISSGYHLRLWWIFIHECFFRQKVLFGNYFLEILFQCRLCFEFSWLSKISKRCRMDKTFGIPHRA